VPNIVTYNIYLLPISARDIPFMGDKFAVAQEDRATLIASFLGPFDVAILSEVYDNDARRVLLEGLRAKMISQPAATRAQKCAAEICTWLKG
jgi:hypothetical protein